LIKVSKIDILAVGAHPDDVEVGAGGLLTKFIKLGLTVGIVDLTAGEMASNGTPEERRQEALAAAGIMGAAWRQWLGIPDRVIKLDKENILRLVEIIRESRPKLVLCPYWQDRHPDHTATSNLVQEAYFDSGLKKVSANSPAYRPPHLWYYFLARAGEPKFIVDISAVYKIKQRALAAYASQFGREAGQVDTFLNTGPGNMLALVESRDRYYGSLIGCFYGEGFTTGSPLAIGNPLGLLGVTP